MYIFHVRKDTDATLLWLLFCSTILFLMDLNSALKSPSRLFKRSFSFRRVLILCLSLSVIFVWLACCCNNNFLTQNLNVCTLWSVRSLPISARCLFRNVAFSKHLHIRTCTFISPSFLRVTFKQPFRKTAKFSRSEKYYPWINTGIKKEKSCGKRMDHFNIIASDASS